MQYIASRIISFSLVKKHQHYHQEMNDQVESFCSVVKRTRMDIMQISVTFFSTSEPKYTNLKTGLIKSKNMQCTIFSIRVIIWKQNSALYTRGPPRGQKPGVSISMANQRLLILTPCPQGPLKGAPQFTQLVTLASVGWPAGKAQCGSNCYTRLENLALSYSVFLHLVFCRKHRLMKPLELSSVATLIQSPGCIF